MGRIGFACIALIFITLASAHVHGEEAKTTAPKPVLLTEANKALNQLVTLDHEGELFELLRICDEKGVQYIVNEQTIRTDTNLMIKVKNVPLKEVLQMAARAASLNCEVSPSGIVTLVPDPELTAAKQQTMQAQMMDRFRNMRNRGKGGDRGQRGEERERPAQIERQDRPQPGLEGNKAEGVF